VVYALAFVDSISDTANVRLNLTSPPWAARPAGTSFGPPPRRRSAVSTLLTDGEAIPASVYGNRMLTLSLYLAADGDTAATQLQLLSRELDRPANILRYTPGTTNSIYFLTLPSDFNAVDWDPVAKLVTVNVLAQPFGYGLKQTAVAAATLYADPAHPGAFLNANPFFETDVSGWASSGGTFVRSTAQFHQGAASGLLTPDGVTATVLAETVHVVFAAGAGPSYRGQAWVRCAVSRNVVLNLDWYTSANAYISSTALTLAVTLNTWTLLEVAGDAPTTAGRVGLSVTMTGTPPASNTLFIDEAWSAPVGHSGANGCYVDIPAGAVLGDVETPCDVTVDSTHLYDNAVQPKSVLAVRRRGTPVLAPLLLQAEAMTTGTTTTIQANDANYSGAGQNFMRSTFSTTTMLGRLSKNPFPASSGVDVRGTYRVFARVRKSVSGDTISVQFQYSYGAFTVTNDAVVVPNVTVNQLVDVGLCTFPVGPDPVFDGYSNVELPVDNTGVSVQVNAQRSAGTGTLDFDYLLFVPADDCLAMLDWANETLTTLTVHVDGISETVWAAGSGTVYSFSPSTLAGRFPRLSPNVAQRLYLVPVVGNIAAETVGYTYTVSVTYFPRYLYVRPAAT